MYNQGYKAAWFKFGSISTIVVGWLSGRSVERHARRMAELIENKASSVRIVYFLVIVILMSPVNTAE